MCLIISCDKCKKELNEPGALVFSPPSVINIIVEQSVTQKYHICTKCYIELFKFINEPGVDQEYIDFIKDGAGD